MGQYGLYEAAFDLRAATIDRLPRSSPTISALVRGHHFDYCLNMETKSAVTLLAALAQETRLSVFRLLVEQGPDGLPAGQIAERLDISPATLSFHLKELTHAGLTLSRQEGRFVIYSAHYEAMNGLLSFLTENCCAGSPCDATASACAPSKR